MHPSDPSPQWRLSAAPQGWAPARSQVLGGAILCGAAIAAAGLAPLPRSFPDFRGEPVPASPSQPIPEGLPEPVERFLRNAYGPRLPVVSSVVVTGRARIRPIAVWLPARFRFTHQVGVGYRHYIEATWFGAPFLRVNESYIDGVSRFEVPGSGVQSGAALEQAANLGMWAELAAAVPSVLATAHGLRWEAVNSTNARLIVPLGASGHDQLDVGFDPASGLLATLRGMRYRSSGETEKILWTARQLPGPTVGPFALPAVGTATWADQGRPWARFTTEQVTTNVDVSGYLRERGI